MHFGYVRVSAKAQHLHTQLEQLKAAGVGRLFQRDPGQSHTSFHGQKYCVAVNSIHATHS